MVPVLVDVDVFVLPFRPSSVNAPPPPTVYPDRVSVLLIIRPRYLSRRWVRRRLQFSGHLVGDLSFMIQRHLHNIPYEHFADQEVLCIIQVIQRFQSHLTWFRTL